jgi:hypothetical protein
MITEILLRELRASGRYRQIYSLGSNVRGDYVLRGHLYDFREIDAKVLLARVAFDFELDKSKTGAIVWTRYYSHDEPVDGKDVAAVVAAIDRNVQSGLTEIIGGLDEYFAKQTAADEHGMIDSFRVAEIRPESMPSAEITSYKPTSRDLSARCPTGLLPNRPPVQNRPDLLRFTAFELRRASDKLSQDCWCILGCAGSIG